MKKIIYVCLGFVCFALGTIGVFLPFLPTVPFYMATAFFFGCSSERLHSWFIGSDLYKKHLEELVQRKSMPLKSKIVVLSMVTLVMGFGFMMMSRVPVARVVLVIIWLLHVIYLSFVIKTNKGQQ